MASHPVTLMPGAGGTGLVKPKLGMVTDKGTITAIGNNDETVTVSGSHVKLTEDLLTTYPHLLFVTGDEATDEAAYPTGVTTSVMGVGEITQVDYVARSVYVRGDGTVVTV